MPKPLSLQEWHDKIDRLEWAKQNQNWEEWQRIAHEGEIRDTKTKREV